LHERGVVSSAPGLYFVGLRFQYAAVSDVLPGVGRDAAHVARHLVSAAGRRSAAPDSGSSRSRATPAAAESRAGS
jgi:putative flavoprotein involved in K+ transport